MEKFIGLIEKHSSMWRWALVGMSTAVIDYVIFISMYSVIKSVLIANFIAGLISIPSITLLIIFGHLRARLIIQNLELNTY